ncbi:hypothetical protein EZ315_12720 [Duncaniella freteri]|uniref:Uncharacterized protein n=1 Tax=Duncaniella freteri TaxID=2530391 RepID=A0A4Z0V5C6_9BACT|nr:hypothetical protein [Duncaniella freteri]TGG36691.1 hypothetical protein EZ315_12720 [Duncaniella freteri]
MQRLPPFSSESWHIDSYSGNAKSNTGLEFGFGCEWMITDTALIQMEKPEQTGTVRRSRLGHF